MEVEKIKTAAYTACATAVAVVVLLCGYKLGKVLTGAEQVINSLNDSRVVANTGAIINDANEIINHVRNRAPSNDNSNNSDADPDGENIGGNEVSNRFNNNNVANSVRRLVDGGAQVFNKINCMIGYAVLINIIRWIWWFFYR